MTQNSLTLWFPDIRLASVALINGAWEVLAKKLGTETACPRCQVVSSAQHSTYQRRFWDLPIQGRPVRIALTVCRWQCRNAECGQSVLAERLLGHGIGGRPGERLAGRLGFAGGRATILRHLIRHRSLPDNLAPAVVGLDERASRKGLHYGTIAVDLAGESHERHAVCLMMVSR
jgi:hypothetical protein